MDISQSPPKIEPDPNEDTPGEFEVLQALNVAKTALEEIKSIGEKEGLTMDSLSEPDVMKKSMEVIESQITNGSEITDETGSSFTESNSNSGTTDASIESDETENAVENSEVKSDTMKKTTAAPKSFKLVNQLKLGESYYDTVNSDEAQPECSNKASKASQTNPPRRTTPWSMFKRLFKGKKDSSSV